MKLCLQLVLVALVCVTASSLAAQQEIDVQRNAVSIASGGVSNVGNSTGKAMFTVTYTILNTGTSNLTITSVTGSSPSNVIYLTNPPASGIVPAMSQTTFTVDLTPQGDGAFGMTLTIVNDDADEGTYTILIRGDTGTKKKKDSKCSTSTDDGTNWMFVSGALSAILVSTRLRRRKVTA